MKNEKEYMLVNKRKIILKDHIGTKYAQLEVDTILGSIGFRKKFIENVMSIQKKHTNRIKEESISSIGSRLFFSFHLPIDEYWSFRNKIVDLLKDETNFYDEPSVDEIIEEASGFQLRKKNETEEEFLDRIRSPNFKWEVFKDEKELKK